MPAERREPDVSPADAFFNAQGLSVAADNPWSVV
jgi:hypothetical protein